MCWMKLVKALISDANPASSPTLLIVATTVAVIPALTSGLACNKTRAHVTKSEEVAERETEVTTCKRYNV